MNLAPLLDLLKQPYNSDNCVSILHETTLLYREDEPYRWLFLLLNRIFHQILENPEMYDAERSDPVLETVFRYALACLDAVELNDAPPVEAQACRLTEAYCGFP